jgi:excisionase family DNA binding protein
MAGPSARKDDRAQRSLVDIDAVAVRLGVQVRHVRRLVYERRIPFIKWGHLLRFDPTEIESWLDARRCAVPRDRASGRAS